MLFVGISWALFGLIIGSFVNVLIARHGVKSILGRSACPLCHRTLEWYELFPVFSWLALRGKCRTCHSRISIQYPVVELLTGAGFLAIGLAPVPIIAQFLGATIIALLIAIAVYDLYHTVIPDVWSYSFAALAGAFSLSIGLGDWWLAAAGPLIALPLFLLWLVSGGRWMGLGDAKLALGIGWLLGLLGGYVALSLAFTLGAFVGVFILIPLPFVLKSLSRAGPMRQSSTSYEAGITHSESVPAFTMKSEIPFGPFLICALSIVWFSQLYGFELVRFLTAFLSWS